MIIATLARSLAKVACYILLSFVVGRTLGNPEVWFNRDLVSHLGHMIYGAGEIGADNFYYLYFYFSVITVFSITTVIYILAMTLIRKIRKT
ncbi:hypothetical protein ACQKDS_19540 [Serratia sp. NPDC078593]|uniref:hypothetical protein n=1 Tax=unclassified Serratia (in: enterobacteria) TaxID=2647522 RepID=UPI0037CE626B